jgi:hypothetical protein
MLGTYRADSYTSKRGFSGRQSTRVSSDNNGKTTGGATIFAYSLCREKQQKKESGFHSIRC